MPIHIHMCRHIGACVCLMNESNVEGTGDRNSDRFPIIRY